MTGVQTCALPIFVEGFCTNFGLSLWRLLISTLPILITGTIFVELNFELSGVNIFIFIFMLFVSFLFHYTISYIIGLLTYWTKSTGGLRHIKSLTISVVGGGLIPLTFFPDSIYKVFMLLPFKYFIYYPVKVLQGSFGLNELVDNIPLMSLWLAFLLVICFILDLLSKRKQILFGG